ncbi:MAG: DsrE family protein [Wenzhouxiangella sp.]
MKCSDFHVLFHAHLDDELDPDTASACDRHAQTCVACGAELAGQMRTRAQAREILAPGPPRPDEIGSLRMLLQREAGTPRRPGRNPLALAAAAALAALAFGMGLFLASDPAPRDATQKYVYHINDTERATAALQNIMFHLEAAPQAHFVVVTHNEGVDFLLHDARDAAGRPFEPVVQQLAGQGVQFRVCGNTLRVRGIDAQQVVPEASLVPSGIAEVGRLQTEENYAYLKP